MPTACRSAILASSWPGLFAQPVSLSTHRLSDLQNGRPLTTRSLHQLVRQSRSRALVGPPISLPADPQPLHRYEPGISINRSAR
eukprot:8664551-Pyramimonas_sp.AAC.1